MTAWLRFLPWVVLLVLAGLWLRERDERSELKDRAETAEAVADTLKGRVDSLKKVEAALKTAYDRDTAAVHHYHTAWDTLTLPGRIDSVPKPVLVAAANVTINSCLRALSRCEQRVAVAEARADTEAERADSLKSASASWKKLSRGPFLQPMAELTTTLDGRPELAGSFTVGRGQWRPMVRGEIGDEALVKVGVRWVP